MGNDPHSFVPPVVSRADRSPAENDCGCPLFKPCHDCYIVVTRGISPARAIFAGWSSPVARQAHNLKVVGSNPTPATKISPVDQAFAPDVPGFFMGCEPFEKALVGIADTWLRIQMNCDQARRARACHHFQLFKLWN